MHHPDTVYSTAEREAMLARMKRAASVFYADAISIGCHPFIEWTGLLNEYIKIAEEAHRQGIDFTQLNTHTGAKLPIESFHLDYLNQKLDCIFSGQVKAVAGDVPIADNSPRATPRRAAPKRRQAVLSQ